MKATLSLLLADLPGLPMANGGKTVLAATPVAVVRKVRRCTVGDTQDKRISVTALERPLDPVCQFLPQTLRQHRHSKYGWIDD